MKTTAATKADLFLLSFLQGMLKGIVKSHFLFVFYRHFVASLTINKKKSSRKMKTEKIIRQTTEVYETKLKWHAFEFIRCVTEIYVHRIWRQRISIFIFIIFVPIRIGFVFCSFFNYANACVQRVQEEIAVSLTLENAFKDELIRRRDSNNHPNHKCPFSSGKNCTWLTEKQREKLKLNKKFSLAASK